MELFREGNIAFPEPHWFFYWRISHECWREELQAFPENALVIIPINWGFHHRSQGSVDLGQESPDCNLAHLYLTIRRLGKQVLFLLPLTPLPFVNRGGVPHFIETEIVRTKEGLPFVTVDNLGGLIRLSSFQSPQVHRFFKEFVWNLQQSFSDKQLIPTIKGLNAAYFENNQLHNYTKDYSVIHQKSYQRYLEQLKQTPSLESQQQFEQLILDLYQKTAEETLKEYWEGTVNISFLGGNPYRVIGKTLGPESTQHLTEFFWILQESWLPSRVLLGANEQQQKLESLSKLASYQDFSRVAMKSSFYDDEQIHFSRFIFLTYERTDAAYWKQHQLTSTLERYFKGLYEVSDKVQDPLVRVKRLEHVSEAELKEILESFIDGESFILDLSFVDGQRKKRLEQFFLMNKITVERQDFEGNPFFVSHLQDSFLVLIDSQKIGLRQEEFWLKILGLFEEDLPQLRAPDYCLCLWFSRHPHVHELSLKTIKHAYFYNDSLEVTEVEISFSSPLEFKFLLRENVTLKNQNSQSFSCDLGPSGLAIIEFKQHE